LKSSNDFIITYFLRYGRLVLQLAFQNTANMPEAEDITQEVFLKLMVEAKEFKDDEHIKAWLIRVTAKFLDSKENTVRSWLRRAKKRLRMNLEGEESYEVGNLYISNAKN